MNDLSTDHHGSERDDRKVWMRWVGALLTGVLLASLFIYVTQDRADAVDMECTSSCPDIKAKHRKAEKMFKAGETGRSNGFAVKKMWENPRFAKKWYGTRIGNLMKRKAESAAAATAGADGAVYAVPVPGECQDWRCAGIREYKRLTDHAKCVDRDPAIFPPTKKSCKMSFDPAEPFTAQDIRDGGRVVVCGGMLAIAARVRGERVVAGLTGAECTFATWELLD